MSQTPAHPHPGFLVIGAQKCGTSWLHRHLAHHPQLWMPADKDLEFFSYLPHLEQAGLANYRSGFDAAGPRLAGEATASYFWTGSDSPWCRQPEGFNPRIPETVHQLLGDELKLIVCLRDPVERALSAWAHYVGHGELSSDVPLRDAARYGGIVDMGFYGKHLGAWLDHYDGRRILVLSLEQDIIHRPASTLSRVFAFLGVGNISLDDEIVCTPVFRGRQRDLHEDGSIRIEMDASEGALVASADDVAWLCQLFRDDVARLKELTGRDFGWARFDPEPTE